MKLLLKIAFSIRYTLEEEKNFCGKSAVQFQFLTDHFTTQKFLSLSLLLQYFALTFWEVYYYPIVQLLQNIIWFDPKWKQILCRICPAESCESKLTNSWKGNISFLTKVATYSCCLGKTQKHHDLHQKNVLVKGNYLSPLYQLMLYWTTNFC